MNELASVNEGTKPSTKLNVDRRRRLMLLIGICCVGFFIADVATPSSFKKPFPTMLILCVVTAQLTVICVWGTLVRGTFWIRLPWTLLLLVLSWCAFAWGISIEKGSPDPEAMFQTAQLLAFGFVTSFVPLKIAALFFRWQIIKDSSADQNSDRASRYAIRDIMIGTLLLALSMGIARTMLPEEDLNLSRALNGSIFNQPEGLLVTTIYGIVSLLVKLPCIWISLGEKAEKIKSRIGLWVVYCFALTIVEIGVMIAIFGIPVNDSAGIFGGLILGHQIMGAIMLGVCLPLRGLGYRLVRATVEVAHA